VPRVSGTQKRLIDSVAFSPFSDDLALLLAGHSFILFVRVFRRAPIVSMQLFAFVVLSKSRRKFPAVLFAPVR
jgi:hypothetical protein